MQRIVTVTVPMPTGGMTNDPRDKAPAMCRVITNFDVITDRKRATPYAESVDGATGQANQKYQNWTVALGASSIYRLFGLGVVTGSGKAQIDFKFLTTGGSTDLDDNAWGSTANNASSSGSASMNLFVYYKKTGLIYGAKAGTTIWAYDPSGGAGFDDANHSLSYTNIAQGLVHSQDDTMYIPYDNKIATLNNSTWTDAALTLPSEFYVTSICEYGAYLGIGCAPLSGVGRSRVYVWDRNSSLTTVTNNLDWGEGTIEVLEEIQGYLVGISYAADQSRTKYRVTFRYYTGTGGAIPFREFTTTTGGVLLLRPVKQKVNTRVYFMMSVNLNGAQREGVWSISKLPNEDFTIVHERTPNNDTLLTANGVLRNFYLIGDFLFQAYVDASSNEKLSKTADINAATYSATSIFETIINPNMPEEDKAQKKTLISVGATYDALPAAGVAVVKARVNEASSYTTVFSETTDSAVKTEPTPMPAAGTYLDSGSEFEFRMESTGAAVPNALIYKYSVEESNM